MQTCGGAVDRSGYLEVCTGKIANKLVTGDRYLGANRKWAITNAIIINPVLSLVGTFGEFRQLEAGHTLAVIEQSFNRTQNYVQSILVAKFLKATPSQSKRCSLSVHIAQRHIWQAYIGRNQIYQALHRTSLFVELHTGKLETFLEYLCCIGRPRTRVLASHLCPVRLARCKCHQFSFIKDWHDQRNI